MSIILKERIQHDPLFANPLKNMKHVFGGRHISQVPRSNIVHRDATIQPQGWERGSNQIDFLFPRFSEERTKTS